MKPESRRAELFAQSVGDELVIYDTQSHEAHRLSPTAAIVWQGADGQRSVSELSASVRQSLAATAMGETSLSDADGEELVRLALEELDRVGLLAKGLPPLGEPMSRREMIGVTAALLPVIASIVAPTPAMAQTFPIGCTGVFPSAFNGTYTGQGTPGQPNQCGLGSSAVTITLNFPLLLTVGSMTITHGTGPSAIVFNSPSVQGALVPVAGSCVLRVTGTGSTGPQGYQTTNQFDFALGTPAGVSGAQQITYPQCGTTPYNITGHKI